MHLHSSNGRLVTGLGLGLPPLAHHAWGPPLRPSHVLSCVLKVWPPVPVLTELLSGSHQGWFPVSFMS